MSTMRSEKEVREYYDFCINMEIIAAHNVGWPIAEISYKKAVGDVCKYMDMNPADYPREFQPNTEKELSYCIGHSNAIQWVLDNILKEEFDNVSTN
jgi:hypothetical protein